MQLKRALRGLFAVSFATLALTCASFAQNGSDTSKSYGFLAGLKLTDHHLCGVAGGTVTHSNGFTSIISVNIDKGIGAIEYNAALRLTRPAPFTLRAVFGPNVEARDGDLTGPDRLTLLMMAAGLAVTYKPAHDASITLSANYLVPSGPLASYQIALVGHVGI